MQWEPVRFRFLLLRNVLLYWSIPSIIGGLFFLLRPGTLVSHIIANSEISLLRQAEYILVFLLGSTGANTLVVGLLRLCAAYFGDEMVQRFAAGLGIFQNIFELANISRMAPLGAEGTANGVVSMWAIYEVLALFLWQIGTIFIYAAAIYYSISSAEKIALERRHRKKPSKGPPMSSYDFA